MATPDRVSAEALTTLTRVLSESWVELNAQFFSGQLQPPVIEIRELGRQLGRWEHSSRQIVLAQSLVVNQTWGVVLEVLKHEMVHQFVYEVLGRVDEAPHGPGFRSVCARLGVDASARGLPTDQSEDPQRDKTLGRVQRLLALAGSDNIHEAQAAMKAAQKLMLRYNIDLLEADQPPPLGFVQLGPIRQRHSSADKVLSGILGAHFFVRCIWVFAWDVHRARRGRVLEVCGTQANLDIASYVYDFLQVTAERLWEAHKRAEGIRSNADRRRFLCGVMIGFSESLEVAERSHQKAGLVWVGDPRVDVWFRQRHPRVRRGSGGRVRVNGAWEAGRDQGRKIVLHRAVSTKRTRKFPKWLTG